jgi:hypothetical protein
MSSKTKNATCSLFVDVNSYLAYKIGAQKKYEPKNPAEHLEPID